LKDRPAQCLVLQSQTTLSTSYDARSRTQRSGFILASHDQAIQLGRHRAQRAILLQRFGHN
jgi:hypothetical protein